MPAGMSLALPCSSGFRKYHSHTRLILTARLMSGHEAWLEHLRQLASGLSVKFVVSAPGREVQQHLCASKVLWHLTGYDVDELDR